jgi:raffinose/stachyose/melibiose transport system substrate-binding protein
MVMRRKSLFKILAGAVGLGLMLSGCSAGSSGADTKTVVYWSMFNKGEPLQQVIQKMIDKFQSENPNIKIEANWAGRDVLTKIQAAVQAGTPVDIVDQSNDRIISSLVNNKLAVKLDKYLAEPSYGQTSGTWADDFAPGAVKAFASSDGTYMIPRESYISGIWYNVDMLAKSGIKPSATGTTWDQFLADLDTLAKKNPDVSPLGADGSIDFYNNWWFSYLAIRTAGLEAFQAAAKDATGEAWKAPAFLKAAEMVRGLQNKGYFQKGFQGSVYPAMQAQWANSKVAMFLNGAWIPKEVGQQVSSSFHMDVFAFPNVEGGLGNNLVEYWSNAWAVLNLGKQTESAVKFLKFATSLKQGGVMLTDAGFPVPLKGAATPPEYKGQEEILASYKTMEQRGGLQGEPTYTSDVYNFCDDPFFLMNTSPNEFIQCLATQSVKYWVAHPAK